jgi:membrane protease YdiL (CAAX protease family)
MLTEKPWRPDAVLRLFMGIFASISAGSLILMGLERAGWTDKGHAGLLLFVVKSVFFQGMGLALIHVFLREHGAGWRESFGFDAPQLNRAVSLAFLVGAMSIPMAWVLSMLSEKVLTAIHLSTEAQPAVQALQKAGSLGEKIYFGFVALGLAPFVEELLFRGILYPLLKKFGRREFALWGTSVFFAAIHFNLMTFLPLTCLAVAFTLLYERTGNLLSPILAHSLFNATNFVYLLRQMNEASL